MYSRMPRRWRRMSFRSLCRSATSWVIAPTIPTFMARSEIAHVTALTALWVVEDLHRLAGMRILEALTGRLPAGARLAGLRAITPALEYGTQDDESAHAERIRSGAELTANEEDHAEEGERPGEGEQRRSQHSARLLDDDCRAVRHDLAHRLADLGGVESHHPHRVRLHEARVLHQAIHGMPASFLEKLRVLGDL